MVPGTMSTVSKPQQKISIVQRHPVSCQPTYHQKCQDYYSAYHRCHPPSHDSVPAQDHVQLSTDGDTERPWWGTSRQVLGELWQMGLKHHWAFSQWQIFQNKCGTCLAKDMHQAEHSRMYTALIKISIFKTLTSPMLPKWFFCRNRRWYESGSSWSHSENNPYKLMLLNCYFTKSHFYKPVTLVTFCCDYCNWRRYTDGEHRMNLTLYSYLHCTAHIHLPSGSVNWNFR